MTAVLPGGKLEVLVVNMSWKDIEAITQKIIDFDEMDLKKDYIKDALQ